MGKNLYDLKLHEWTHCEIEEGVSPFNTIVRVPGGWIYGLWDNREQEYKQGSIFVPFNDDCDYATKDRKEKGLERLAKLMEPIPIALEKEIKSEKVSDVWAVRILLLAVATAAMIYIAVLIYSGGLK